MHGNSLPSGDHIVAMDVMSRKKIEERIRRKEQEIQELESQLREARSYLQALQDVVKMMPRDDAQDDPEVTIRSGSFVDEARQIILAHGAALHIMDILRAMGRDLTKENRSSLSSSLAAYVRRNEVFTRPKPNTFGLIEFGHGKRDTNSDLPLLPSSFGRILGSNDTHENDI